MVVMKRRYLKFILFSVLSLFFSFRAAEAGAQLLWKVSGNGLEKPSYIFGTHHAAPHGLTDSISGFSEAFVSSVQVYGELVFDSIMNPKVSMAMARGMMSPSDSTVSRLLAPQQYSKLDSAMKALAGIGAKQLEMIKPAAISAQLAMLMSAKEFPEMQKMEQIDMVIQKQAKKERKKIGALETIAFQMNLMYGTPIRQQAEELAEMLDDMDRMPELTRQMAEVYRNQDLDRLLELTEEEGGGSDSEFLERTLYSRNRDWAEKMPAIMAEAPTFFAVGAGHLPGDMGLIALLRRAGYTVEPVE